MSKWFGCRVAVGLGWLFFAAACGGDGADDQHAGGAAAPAGSGGSLDAPAGTGGAPAAGGSALAGSNAPGAGRSGAGASAGSSAGGSGVGGAGGAAGSTSAGGSDAPAMVTCGGMPLPPRAQPKAAVPIGPEAAGLEPYWPTSGFRSMAPDMLGFDTAKLQAAIDYEIPGSNTQALLVVRHGYLAVEEYFGAFGANTRHESYSMAKSFSSALVGIAIGAGLLTGVDEKVCEYYPDNWDCSDTSDPRSRITIEHVMNISTGLRWSENWRSDATGTNDAFNFNLLATVLSREAVTEPGTEMRYSTGDPALLTGVIQGATGKTALAYAQEVLFSKIGISGVTWNSDTSGRTTTYAGLQATAVEYAKFGYLYLNRGKWDGQQVVPEDWVDMTTQGDAPCEDWYRYLWHQNPPVRLGTQPSDCAKLFCPPTAFADLPPDTFFAEGINGQFIFIVPSADMVVVRLAADTTASEGWDEMAAGLLSRMLDAIK